MGWLNAAKANGLKVVAILGPNKKYADNYDPIAMSNLAAWIAKTGLVTAFEITNEPNNTYESYEGPTWRAEIFDTHERGYQCCSRCEPSVQVIGLGA